MTLSEFYMNLRNPINDSENLERIVDTYSKSSDFKEDILKLNSGNDMFSINMKDRDRFYLQIYNLWVLSINRFFRNDSELSREDKVRFNKLYWYIDDHRPKCANDVLKFFNPNYVLDEDLKSILKKYKWNFADKKGYSYFDCNAICCGFKEPVIPKHKLYVNVDSEASYNFLTNYVNECAKRGQTFYFKLNPNSKRDNSCVIYADDDNLLDTIKIINTVLDKNNELCEHISMPPVTSSRVSDYIGFGSKVDPEIYGDNVSFNDIRSHILSSNIDKTTREWIGDNLDTVVVSEDREVSYGEHFMNLLYLFKKIELENAGNGSMPFILDSENSKDFEDKFVSMIDSHYKEIVEAIKYNREVSFDIDVNGYIININNDLINEVIKSQTINIYREDFIFRRRLKNNIWTSCNHYGVDSTKFSCNADVYVDFLEMDANKKIKK